MGIQGFRFSVFQALGFQVVCPMPSIDFPGARVVDRFLKYSSTRVIVSSTRIYKIKQTFLLFLLNIKVKLSIFFFFQFKQE
jgi:hypothetical protein